MDSAFPKILRELMLASEINGITLARQTGISQAAISNYLSGKREPCLTVFCKLADYFEITLDVLGRQTPILKPRRQSRRGFSMREAAVKTRLLWPRIYRGGRWPPLYFCCPQIRVIPPIMSA